MLMALVMAFLVCVGGVGSGRFDFGAKMVGSVGSCGFAVLRVCVLYSYKNDFNIINKSMALFWFGFGLVLELFLVVRMVGY